MVTTTLLQSQDVAQILTNVKATKQIATFRANVGYKLASHQKRQASALHRALYRALYQALYQMAGVEDDQ